MQIRIGWDKDVLMIPKTFIHEKYFIYSDVVMLLLVCWYLTF